MSPRKINRPGPALGPIACSTCRNSGDAPSSRRATGAQTPNRGGKQSSLAFLIVFLCALEALLIWSAFGGASGVFLVWAQFALIIIASVGYRFYEWVFDDETVSSSSHHSSWDYSPRSNFSERLHDSRSGSYAAGAAGIGLAASSKKGSKSSDSSGCAASTPGSGCGTSDGGSGGGCGDGGGGCGGGGCGGC